MKESFLVYFLLISISIINVSSAVCLKIGTPTTAYIGVCEVCTSTLSRQSPINKCGA